MITLFSNTVTLRGFLGSNAEAPASDHIQEDSFAILLLATVSGVWDLGNNQWNPRTDWHRIICPGPFLCGMVRGMRRGDYLEVEGELRSTEREFEIVKDKKKTKIKIRDWEVRANTVKKLAKPQSSREENLDAEPVREDDAA